MESSRDVFVIAVSCAADPAQALRQTIKEAWVNPARVQDFIFGADRPILMNPDELAREILINCPVVMVSTSMRALFFATQAILCDDADLVLVGGGQAGQFGALLLASPVSVGIYNLTPLARMDARSLTSTEHALKKAELTSEDVQIRMNGTCGVLLAVQVIEQLQEQKDAWGLVSVGKTAILIERV
jgi:hypothetical protein